jgi:Ca2+-binding RTX toxin-like protein
MRWAVPLAATLAFVLPQAASASTLQWVDDPGWFPGVTYTAADGEQNDMLVQGVAAATELVVISDQGATINAADEPTSQNCGIANHSALCDSTEVAFGFLTIDLGNGADTMRVEGNSITSTPHGELGSTYYGGGGIDSLLGGIGGEYLDGDLGGDDLSGRGGHDTIVGGPGHDVLRGGKGNDFLSARDGEPDTISCGGGNNDYVVADLIDFLITRGACETIDVL